MLRLLLLAALTALSFAATAQTPIADLSSCLADNTSGKDRKDLAKWVFLAMASHPEIRQYASADAAAGSPDTHKATAALFTRLLADDCARQTQAAVKDGGAVAIQGAFQSLGQLAMQELMSNKDVAASMGAFEKYLDKDKLNKALAPK
jgi:hypothetical protein